MNIKKLQLLTLALSLIGATAVYSDITYEEQRVIDTKVASMSLNELKDRRSELLNERNDLMMAQQNGDSSPSTVKRLESIIAELSSIQKALIAILGVSAISALTDDGYNDNVPPVITINGSNPATVELGATYTDAGATANDAFHGSTAVTSSSNVDTSVVGSYTVTYTATDLDNNTATASRTVNVVDTTAPVVTVNW